jgi:methionyl-tRNA formyltransferase
MSNSLRVVFAGTPHNAAFTLETLVKQGVHIVGVLTRKDAPAGRSRELAPSPVSMKAQELGIEVFKSNTIDNLALAWLEALSADIGAVVAYGTIFKLPVLEVPRLGWLNLHYSLLPELPGPAPVQHAILQGRKNTGVTVFRLDTGIDTGPIVSSAELEIKDTDTAGELLARLTVIGSGLLTDVLLADESKLSSAQEQSIAEKTATASKPTRELAKLDFSGDATTQLNKIRAMNPEPMAWFEFNETSVRVIRARQLSYSSDQAVARVVDKELVVGCKEGSLVLALVQPANKSQMSGADWFRGLRVENLKLS